MKTETASHMIRYEDLNHHESLYAGRASEWMIEASFLAVAAERGVNDGVVYKNTHKFDFIRPCRAGDIITLKSTVVRTGGKTITVRVGIYNELSGDLLAEGFTTFVTIDEATWKTVPCDIKLDATDDPEELAWRKEADSFFD